MASAPLISVLLSVYNGRLYVQEAVESILSQTLGDFELLIIDDGSKDDSVLILKRLEKQDSRIRLIARENRGLTVTLNELFASSRGEFLARMDCDDVALPHRFAVQIDALRRHPKVVCTGGCFELIDASGRSLTTLRPPTDNAEIQRQVLRGHGAICHPCAMIRRDAMQQIGGYDERYRTAQDLDLWLRLGEVGELANVPETILKFRLHESSVSETRRLEQRRYARLACERAWARRGVAGTFDADEPWRPGEDAASKLSYALKYGWWAFNSGQRRTAMHYAMKAIRTRPFDSSGWKLLTCAAFKRMGKNRPDQKQSSGISSL
jgi:glycosyltransferase involved in cell wall biosynthesis